MLTQTISVLYRPLALLRLGLMESNENMGKYAVHPHNNVEKSSKERTLFPYIPPVKTNQSFSTIN